MIPLHRRAQQGYALLLVVFFMTVLLVSAMAISPSILTSGRRENEEEMIWRGHQYVRGIRLFYRKLGRFPTSVEDLTKAQVGSLRFMRQGYKDPMNKVDGTWRLLYVGPTGQLIGSLRPQQSNLQMPNALGVGTPAAALGSIVPPSGALGSTTQPGTAPGAQPGSQTGTSPTGAPPTGTSGTDTANGQNDPMLNPPPDSGSSTIIGGNVIGVGSKVNQRSLRVYEKAKNYKLFEFYWDPAKDTAAALQNGTQPGNIPGSTPVGTPATPNGAPPGGGTNPPGPGGTSPPPPQPNPQQ